MTATDANVQELKNRLHISHDSEDAHLKSLIETSHAAIQASCGEFDLDAEPRGKELVYERVRYAYNDALEYFEDNFLSAITAFNFYLYAKSLPVDEEATTDGSV